MDEIVGAVRRVNDMISEITARPATEQSTGIGRSQPGHRASLTR